MDQTIYRDGKVLTRKAFHKVLSKALSATGEHDVWAGSAATMPQPNGTSPLAVSSSSLQDAALVRDTYTATTQMGSDLYYGLTVGGVVHASTRLGGMAALATAIESGTKESWAIVVSVLPTAGQGVDITIGAEAYQWLLSTEATVDEAAAAIAAELVSDPLYDVAAVGFGSGAIELTAKTPNTETADVVVTLTDDGTITSAELFGHGPASTTHSATESGGTLTVTRDTIGVASTITADTDNLVLTHTVTGGSGSGLRTLQVRYLDDAGLYRQETLTLTGTTAVETAHDCVTLLDAQAKTSGSAGAVGTVTIADGAPTTIATIAVGDSEIKQLTYTVPAGDLPRGAWSLVGLQASVTSAAACTLRVRVAGPRGARLVYQASLPASTNHAVDLDETPIQIEAGETLRVTLEGNGSTTTVTVLGYGEGAVA